MDKYNKKYQKPLAVAIILFFTLIFFAIIISGDKSPNKSKPQDNNQTIESKIDYELISHENNKTVENYWLLIKSNNASEQELEELAKEFKKSTCKKDCNISMYDDKKAAEADLEYKKMTSDLSTNPTDLEKWKQNNYVFVADHLVGYMMFGDDSFASYPYRDWYYKELKSK